MRQDQFEELMKAAEKGDYMSIGISDDDRPFGGCFVPWRKTGTAMNMKLPRVMITPEDLENADIREAMRKCTLVGCYIFTALSDYSFLSELKKLRDIFILHGENIKDLEFVRPLTDCSCFTLKKQIYLRWHRLWKPAPGKSRFRESALAFTGAGWRTHRFLKILTLSYRNSWYGGQRETGETGGR